MSAITLDGELVQYQVLGRGRPVILLHGWIGSWRYWVPIMQQLQQKYRVYALDFYGFGDSAKNKDRYSVAQQARLLENFMEKLAVPKAAIIGHALGAVVACEFVAKTENREKVPRLVLSNLPLFNPGNLEQRSSGPIFLTHNIPDKADASPAPLTANTEITISDATTQNDTKPSGETLRSAPQETSANGDNNPAEPQETSAATVENSPSLTAEKPAADTPPVAAAPTEAKADDTLPAKDSVTANPTTAAAPPEKLPASSSEPQAKIEPETAKPETPVAETAAKSAPESQTQTTAPEQPETEAPAKAAVTTDTAPQTADPPNLVQDAAVTSTESNSVIVAQAPATTGQPGPQHNPLTERLGNTKLEDLLKKCFNRSQPEYDKLLVDLGKTDDDVLKKSISQFDSGRMLDIVRTLAMPTVIVHGIDDPLLPNPDESIWNYITAESEGQLLPVPLSGIRHFPMLEDDRFSRLVHDFLETPDVNKLEIKERWQRRTR